MPPKKGKGRGRGAPPAQERRDESGQREPSASTSRGRGVQQAPQGFFQPQAQPTVPQEPKAAPKRREQKVEAETLQSLGLKLEQKLEISTPFPKRPGYGTLGRRIKLLVNCFPIQIPSGNVYHYDVEIIPKRRQSETAGAAGTTGQSSTDKKYRCLSTKINRQIVNLMIDTDPKFRNIHPAYDGKKNMYTRKPLSGAIKCNVNLPDDNADPEREQRYDEFEVQIKPTVKKDTSSCAINLDVLHALFERKVSVVPQEALMALETILRHGQCLKFTPVARSFFYPPDPNQLHPLGGGREIWFGYHQSIRLGEWRPLVNVNVTATSFYEKGPLLDFILKLLGMTREKIAHTPTLTDAQIRRLNGELKNLRIEVTHLNYRRKYRILRLIRDSADRYSFELKNKDGTVQNTTVTKYFMTTYKRQLRYPRLPLLQVHPENKRVYLPIEVCELIEGQHCRKKLDDKQTAEMIKVANIAPERRLQEIQKIMNSRTNYNRDVVNNEFGIKVSSDPLKVEGRVINAPNVIYNNEKKIFPRNGVWDMREVKFFKAASITSWVCLNFDNYVRQDSLDRFCEMFVRFGRNSGIEINRPVLIDTFRSNVPKKALLQRMSSECKAELAVIVIPGNDKMIYGEIKQAAEKEVGIKTQCVKGVNVNKGKPDVVSNLLQKVNAKMGGVNNSLSPGETPAIFRRPVIVIGADVTHPGPSHEIKPSIAACVGSLDSYLGRYAVTIRAQSNVNEKKEAVEIIQDLKSMIIELLKAFYRHTKGMKPEKIVFLRDGVSEGQFQQVRNHEVESIREACRSLSVDYQPGITFIVVQKRHHTRFFPEDMRDGCGKMRNVPPGTTVDSAVTHPVNFDFFLCSHFGLQGTSKPAHYTVIEDDNRFTADDLQKLTYYLCHIYARCTRSISIPAPVMYAHLAAFRARQHLITEVEESTTSSDTSDFRFRELPQNVINAVKILDVMKNTMYFV